jgi:hypothetical protein
MKFLPLLTSAVSGSFGGIVGSHNRGGLYFRARSVPTNPNTAFQQDVRDNLRIATDRWTNILSAGDRADWEDYAANTPIIDKLGQVRTLTGQQMYVRAITAQLQAAPTLGVTMNAPSVFDLGSFTPPSFVPDDSAQNTAVTFEDTDPWANDDAGWMGVWQSKPQNPSINYFKGPYRYIGVILGNGLLAPTSPATMASPFTLTTGQKVFYQVRVLSPDGRLSNSARYFGTVVA